MRRRTRRVSIAQFLAAGDMVDAIPLDDLETVSPENHARAICAVTGYPAPDQIVPLIELRVRNEIRHAVE
ncbi:MAG: hypothetical protein EBT13_17180 [Rhodobacteraceae bacterium]|jgi:hypothetical protein|nr:hypothetical protein [Paracoccaceae bacterium]